MLADWGFTVVLPLADGPLYFLDLAVELGGFRGNCAVVLSTQSIHVRRVAVPSSGIEVRPSPHSGASSELENATRNVASSALPSVLLAAPGVVHLSTTA